MNLICAVAVEGRRGFRYSGTGLTDGCEQPCKCWEQNLGPQEEQIVLFSAKPSP